MAIAHQKALDGRDLPSLFAGIAAIPIAAAVTPAHQKKFGLIEAHGRQNDPAEQGRPETESDIGLVDACGLRPSDPIGVADEEIADGHMRLPSEEIDLEIALYPHGPAGAARRVRTDGSAQLVPVQKIEHHHAG